MTLTDSDLDDSLVDEPSCTMETSTIATSFTDESRNTIAHHVEKEVSVFCVEVESDESDAGTGSTSLLVNNISDSDSAEVLSDQNVAVTTPNMNTEDIEERPRKKRKREDIYNDPSFTLEQLKSTSFMTLASTFNRTLLDVVPGKSRQVRVECSEYAEVNIIIVRHL